MESTGVRWIPAFEIREARGFDVILVNARHAKKAPGRKTDVGDAGWLRQAACRAAASGPKPRSPRRAPICAGATA
jgi:transposase